MRKALLPALAATFILSGCATITRGSDDVLEIRTDPPGATVQTSNGFDCGSTPCVLTMPRRSEFVATISRPGCRSIDVPVTHRTPAGGGAAVAGNVLVGGLIGLAVDNHTGASQELVPNPIDVSLEC